MSESIVEYFRQQAVTPLLQTGGLPKVWPLWRTEIRRLAPPPRRGSYLIWGTISRISSPPLNLRNRKMRGTKARFLPAELIGKRWSVGT